MGHLGRSRYLLLSGKYAEGYDLFALTTVAIAAQASRGTIWWRHGATRLSPDDADPPSVSTTPSALLRLIRQRWSIENEQHWARDAHFGEHAPSYANRTGAPVFSFLRTIVMNLLRRSGYRSIPQGLRELA